MSGLTSLQKLDVSRLLFDLKRCGELLNRVSSQIDSKAIAACVTDGLTAQFSCAFARIWLVAPDRNTLQLVASSGLHTRLDGSFASVPMGAFKVGKIAQHCIPFLSNCLSEETWVKDRDWAIANDLHGFAGLPLMVNGKAIGVLALFDRSAMTPEFLEVLQMLSIAVAGMLSAALRVEAIAHQTQVKAPINPLSEQLSTILGHQKLSLTGMEQPLAPEATQLFIQTANRLTQVSCQYCRLVYEADTVALEAMLATCGQSIDLEDIDSIFQETAAIAQSLGGIFTVQLGENGSIGRVYLQLTQASVEQNLAVCNPSPLSPREQEVVRLLATGLRDREIAEQLYISERTVKFHIKNLLTKLNVKTRAQAIFETMQRGWL